MKKKIVIAAFLLILIGAFLIDITNYHVFSSALIGVGILVFLYAPELAEIIE